MRSMPLLAFAAVAIVALAACSSGPGSSPAASATASAAPSAAASAAPSPVVPDAAALDGRTFLGTSVTDRNLPDVTKVSLGFQGARLSATGGCNRMGGAYAIKDGKLSVGPMMSTEMACSEPLMAQDQWLSRFLDGAAITLAGDTLTLTGDGATLTLTDERTTNPDRPVEGTTWTLDGIIANQAVSSVPTGVAASLVIADGQAAIKTGCNGGSGSVTLTGATMTFGPIMTTKMACQPAAAGVESAVLGVLSGQVAYTVDGDTLTITNGDQGLVFKAVA